MVTAALLACLVLPHSKPQRAMDAIELKDGTRLEGRVVFEDDRMLILSTGADERELRMTEVAYVRSVPRNLSAALDLYLREPPQHDWQWLGLSWFCESRGLAGEAEVCALGALLQNPASSVAHRLLHHEPSASGWQFRKGDRWLPFVIDAQPRRWSDAWQIDTTHYALRTNLTLETAVRTALELELFYRSFMSQFGAPLKLHEILAPLTFQMHADRGSFPEIASGRGSYFDREQRRVLINAEGGLVRGLVFHEATHQLLAGLASNLPAWVDEGLSEYFASLWANEAVRGREFPNAILKYHFATVAKAEKPYSLEKLLAMSSGDFIASKNAELKYAQAYSLVYFCLHGEDGVYRNGFFHFLRGLSRGKTKASDLLDALDVSEPKLVNGWLAYAAQRSSA
jgi:hypothetical protein